MLAALRVLHVDTLGRAGTRAAIEADAPQVGCGMGRGLAHTIRGLPGRTGLLGLSDSCGRPRLFTERTSVGLDVHARSVAAAIDGVTGELFQSRLTPAYEHIRSWVEDSPGPVAVAYEAGPPGIFFFFFLKKKKKFFFFFFFF